ncbi:MAG: AMP-binding protein [Clostridia bacterium]|nr:AMP-binding protein [Clostridia bacterium]
MTDYGIGNYKSINAFVEDKLALFDSNGHTFEALFELTFREEDNIMWEQSEGYRIRTFTYREVRDTILSKTCALASALADAAPGSVVGLYMENSIEWIEWFWAILRAGFRPLLMNLRLPDELLTDAAASAGCSAVISDGRRFGVPTFVASEMPDSPGTGTERVYGREILFMSSGTSGSVKICAYTAEEFYYQIRGSYGLIKECPLLKKHYDGRLKLLAFLPFYHIFGFVAVYMWFTFFSRTLVRLGDMSPQTILNTIKRHKVTHLFAVPLFWEKVHAAALGKIADRGEKTLGKFRAAARLREKLPGRAGELFSKLAFREIRDNLFGDSISFMITGGSAIEPEVISFFNTIGYRLANGYGMTETGITSVELSPRRKLLFGGCVGHPMENVEYSINGSGELLVRGKTSAAYVIEGGVTTPRGGWFNTHDLAGREGESYRILGRRDDLIVSPGGENINPVITEPLLRPAGSSGVCLIPDKDGEARGPVLLVSVGRFASAETLEAVGAEAKDLIEKARLSGTVRRVAFVAGPLLSDSEIKLNRSRLAKDYSEGRLPLLTPETAAASRTGDELTLKIATYFAAAIGGGAEAIPPDADFFTDCGGTSLDYLSMIAVLEKEFGIPFPTDGGSGLRTAGAFADYIKQRENDTGR